MRNIIRLIQKYRNFLFFLVLELISFLFIFNWRNSFHHSTFIGASNSVTGYMYESKSAITNYFSLREINDKLQSENQYLREKIYNQEIKLGKKFIKVDDTLYLRNYKFLKVQILNSQFKYVENKILLNKGNTNGIKDKMGVIGVKGVIGVVNKSSSHYSSVVPIVNPHFVLSVVHKTSSTWGDLKWIPNVNNYRTATISNIPSYTPINEGDLFVTTGSDGIFPRGIPIGEVKNFQQNLETQMMNVEILLSEDFSNTHTGFVVYNSVRDELFNYNATK